MKNASRLVVAVCTVIVAAGFAPSARAAPECKMGSDGRQVCGYQCRMGSDGHVACANSEDGACMMGSDGHVVCSRLLGDEGGRAECKMGSDGHVVCGFACKMGSDGHVACADSADGVCAMGSDGHVSCSHLMPDRRRAHRRGFEHRVARPRASTTVTPPSCMMGSDGHEVCGYACRMGSDGHVACARHPDGVCAMGSDGHVACSR